MKMRLLTLLFAGLLPFSNLCIADALTKQDMYENIDAMRGFIKSKYCPVEWKKEYAGWDLNEQVEEAKKRIEAHPNLTVKESQKIIRDFFNSLKDYHVNTAFFSSEAAILPFSVKGSENRYFITYIDREAVTNKNFPCEIGDEIISFDGKPVHAVIQDLRKEVGDNVPETDQSLAELFLTARLGAYAHDVPRGSVKVGVLHQQGNTQKTYKLNWKYYSELIRSPNMETKVPKAFGSHLRFQNHEWLSKRFSLPIYHQLDKLNSRAKKKNTSDPNEMGERESFIPNLGNIDWQTNANNAFHAYIYINDAGKSIGYLRIPHYMFFEEEVEDLFDIIAKFEKETDALVFDQVNNTGGSIFFAFAVSSLLAKEPLNNYSQKIIMTQEEFVDAFLENEELKELYNEMDEDTYVNAGGFYINRSMVKEFMEFDEFMMKEWNQGKFYTGYYPLWGFKKLPVHPVTHYTKPILMLINELDFSCGDVVPALLKDNNRVTLLGVRTAGAGGYVVGFTYPNRFGMQYMTLTGSLIQRFNGKPIENLGVQPDIQYTLTPEDLRTNYSPYIQTIKQAVNNLVK